MNSFWKIPELEKYRSNYHRFDRFLPEASFDLRVLSLPASVCPCVCVCACQPRVCPRHNSSLFQARITKCGPEVKFKGWLTLTLKVKFNLEVKISLGPVSPTRKMNNHWNKCTIAMITETASWVRLFHRISSLYVYWSRQPRVFRCLTSL